MMTPDPTPASPLGSTAMSVEAVAATIREGSGTQFDPRIVDALLDHLDEALRLRSVHP